MTLDLAYGEDLAIVTSSRPAGNAGLLVSMHTPRRGQVCALAGGIRKGGSRLCRVAEPLNLLAARCGGDPAALRDARVLDDGHRLRQCRQASQAALLLAGAVERLSGEAHPAPGHFAALLNGIAELRRQPERWPAILARQLLRLLKQAGYAPRLERCARCRREVSGNAAAYDCGLGGPVCPQCPAPPPHRGLPLSPDGLETLLTLNRGELPASAAASESACALLTAAVNWRAPAPSRR